VHETPTPLWLKGLKLKDKRSCENHFFSAFILQKTTIRKGFGQVQKASFRRRRIPDAGDVPQIAEDSSPNLMIY
jgi:hypothetical protein